jgi:hypothetical protein
MGNGERKEGNVRGILHKPCSRTKNVSGKEESSDDLTLEQ